MFRVWQKWTAHQPQQLQSHVQVAMDESAQDPTNAENDAADRASGIHAIDVGYKTLKPHLEKSRAQLSTSPPCVMCHEPLPSDGSMSLICPNSSCNATGHLDCFATSFLREDEDSVVPIEGACPGCGSQLKWVDLVKELSLRMRAPKEVEKVLKERKIAKTKAANATLSGLHDDADPSDDEDEDPQDDAVMEDSWNYVSDSSESDVDEKKIRSDTSVYLGRPAKAQVLFANQTDPIIEDSDWDDAEVLT